MRKEALIGFSVLLVAVSGSATVLDSFGAISGEAEVEPAVEVVEIYSDTTLENNYGEYVVFRNNIGNLDLSDWRIEQNHTGDSTDLDEGDVSSTESNLFAIVDGRDADHSSSDIEIIDVDTAIIGGIHSGDKIINLVFTSKQAVIQETDYQGCSDGGNAWNVSAGECQDKSLEVSEE